VSAGWLPDARHSLVYVAAGVTILFGLLMLDLAPTRRLARWASRALLAPLRAMAGLLESGLGHIPTDESSTLPTLILGLGVGFLPCPLTTALLLSAAGESSVPGGMLLLGGAAIGTAPGLCLVGLLGSAAGARWRSVGTRALGVVVIAIGVAMVLRRSGVLPCH
jgi:sulfite exporter TauE/SafE